jgi:hypothetical protein
MDKAIVKIDPAILALINGAFDRQGLPMPFTREIFLIETQMAGTSHVPIKEIEPGLKEGDCLVFKREPENEHDELAIRICDTEGHKLGYIPREKNEVLARLMDAGKLVFGKLCEKDWHEEWLRIQLKVYMREA